MMGGVVDALRGVMGVGRRNPHEHFREKAERLLEEEGDGREDVFALICANRTEKANELARERMMGGEDE